MALMLSSSRKLGDDIYLAVMDFFDNSRMYLPVNCATISLVPKVPNPTLAKDFRPIACCTTLYKFISKVLTARLQQVITEVVDSAQSGFIPGRQISENILMASELIKGYTRAHISPRCMVKMD